MRKRKLITIIIIMLIGVFMVVTISELSWLFYNMKKDAPKMTFQELKKCFNQNKDKFISAAETINKYPDLVEIQKKNFFAKTDKNFYYESNDKLYIELLRQHNNKAVQDIGNMNIAYILNTLKFEKIVISEGDIYFVEGSDLGTMRGIVYVSVGDKPGDIYITQLDKITDKWFRYKAR